MEYLREIINGYKTQLSSLDFKVLRYAAGCGYCFKLNRGCERQVDADCNWGGPLPGLDPERDC